MYTGFPYFIKLNRGLTRNANWSDRQTGELETALNIATHEGNIQKDFGEVNINSSTLTDIIRAGIDYYPAPTSQRTVISTSGGNVAKSTGVGSGSFSNIKTGLTGTAIPQFIVCGNETTGMGRRLIWINGTDFPQYLDADGSAMERVGFRASLTNAFDTTSGSATLTVNATSHGLSTGDTVSLVGFTNPTNGQNPNVSNASVTVLNTNQFTVTAGGNFNATSTGVGGTGKFYAHPSDWTGSSQPSCGCLHIDRVVLALNNSIYASSTLSHIDFEVGSDVDFGIVYSGYGANISAIASFQGLLIVFKFPYGIIQIANAFTIDQETASLPAQIGIAGKNALTKTENELFFISNLGSIHALSTVQEFGNVKSSSITELFYLDRDIKERVDLSKISRATMTYDAYNKVVLAAYPSKGSSENDFLIKLDLSERGNPKFTYTDKGSYVSMWPALDSASEERIVSGTSDGFIRDITNSIRRADGQTGTAFQCRFQTSFDDFREQYPQYAELNKSFDFLDFTLQPTSTDIDLTFNFYVDGEYRFSKTINRESAAASFTLTFPITFANDLPKEISFPIIGCYGRRLSIECINNSDSQNFKISDLKVKFKPGDERIVME